MSSLETLLFFLYSAPADGVKHTPTCWDCFPVDPKSSRQVRIMWFRDHEKTVREMKGWRKRHPGTVKAQEWLSQCQIDGLWRVFKARNQMQQKMGYGYGGYGYVFRHGQEIFEQGVQRKCKDVYVQNQQCGLKEYGQFIKCTKKKKKTDIL